MFPKVNLQSSLNNWISEINQDLFDVTYSDKNSSAIDLFMAKNKELNQLIVDPSGKINAINEMMSQGEIENNVGRKIIATLSESNNNPNFYNLILLGYVSSVEAYIRKLIRDLVNLDPHVRKKCELQSINLGATYYQDKTMFAEALMENSHFSKAENIKSECNKLLDINIQFSMGSALQVAASDYDSICQLRHCIIHRFGKIGVNNIINLGIHKEDFGHCIEKPIALNIHSIQKASKATVNFVREINHEIWVLIMKRLQKPELNTWTWDLRSDKALFKAYLLIFYDSLLGPINNNCKMIYESYRNSK